MKKRGLGITKVSNLFSKYKNLLRAPQGSVITAFTETVATLFNITIKKEHCSYSPQTKTLSVKVSGMLKTEILLQKKKILQHMAEKLGEANIPKEIL